jgi:hypothetical protein
MVEVVSAVAYLASDEASLITGQVAGVNGGSTMNRGALLDPLTTVNMVVVTMTKRDRRAR